MRTKTLLLTAALSAAGIATSMAQTPTAVYSVNAVGYVNTAFVPGFQIVSNPLNATDNTVGNLFSALPNNSKVYKFNGTSFDIATKAFGSFGASASMTLVPGEAAFVSVPSAVTVTFVGEVPQGLAAELDNPLPQGFSLKASKVPKAGRLTTDLGFPAANNDKVYLFNTATQGYDTKSFSFGNWVGGEPVIAVGQGFFVNKAAASNWHVTFSVNG